ncbi:hypothetical protein [Intrasporangium sp. YIM S08009]|uniref:hypothetical protein n=1 Tax=Intrasporangium zincisolvens TaxID=3080018 RepID=UPI002B054B49|nr:hypothetical protein [Intrasporangium sp. YIM S08009]
MTTDPMNPDPTTPDDLQQRLGAALHGHLDRVAASTDLTGGAVRRSRAIRRNRTVGTSVVAAVAVLAVATPIAWSSLRADRAPVVPATTSSLTTTEPTTTTSIPTSSAPSGTTAPATPATRPATAATSAGSPVVTRDNTRTPRRTVTLGSTLAAGPAPDVAWRLDDTIHVGGSSARLDVPERWTWTSLAGGTGVVLPDAWDTGGPVRIVRADGTTVATALTVPPRHAAQVVADADGTRFAVLVRVPGGSGSDASATVFDARGREVETKTNLLHDVELAGFVGQRVLLGNRVVGRSYVWDLSSNVIDRYTDAGVVRAVDGTRGLAALWTPNADVTAGCTEVVDVSGAEPVLRARSCGEFVPTGFSPDGTSLVGYPVTTDGEGAAVIEVLDIASGRIDLRLKGAGLPEARFLPGGTLALEVLLDVGRPGARNVLATCSAQGRCTRFTEPVPLTMDSARYGLSR